MKKIIQIVLMCLIIAGVIIVATIGFNVGTKYSETTQISIKIGKEFDLKDIKSITNEVFEKQNTQIQYVELYKDMVQITVKEASEEQIKTLNDKINEKYEISNELSNVLVTRQSNVRLRDIVKPYIVPVAIVSVITIVYVMIAFRKLEIWQVLYNTLMTMVAPQAILAGFYAVTRIPVNRLTVVIEILIYIASIMLNIVYLNKIEKNKEQQK
jgi:preprotein translocase subunit SecF